MSVRGSQDSLDKVRKMPKAPERWALVTGANRGLGRETARQLDGQGYGVWAAARSDAKAAAATKGLVHGRPLVMDVSDADDVQAALDHVAQSGTGLSVLINNAAVDYDTDQRAATADMDRIRDAFATNLFGAWQVAQAAALLLGQSGHSTIVNVSSGAGQMTRGGSAPGYSVAKAALNRLTLALSAELAGQGTLVNAVCPGWVATDMGGGGRPVPEGAHGIVWAATLPPDGPTGGFFRDGEPLEW